MLRWSMCCKLVAVLLVAGALLLAGCGAPATSPSPSPEPAPSVRPTSRPSTAPPPVPTAAPTGAARSALETLIAFAGGAAIRTIQADGSDETILARGSSPSWSPDAQWLAYTCQSAESRAAGRYGDICLMAADGSAQRLLIRDGIMPHWSPASDLVAFARSPIDFGDAWVARIDGTHVVQVPGGTPSWSPDGSRLLVLTSPGRLIVNVVRPDGSDFRELGQGWWNATWSPDGDRIAYAEGRQIVAIDIDDGSRELLFTAPTEDVGALLWPPGDRLAYAVNDGDLFLADLGTGTARALTEGLAVRGPLALSPGGDRIAFAAGSGRGIFPDVYVTSLAGAATRLTRSGDGSEPAWQPATP